MKNNEEKYYIMDDKVYSRDEFKKEIEKRVKVKLDQINQRMREQVNNTNFFNKILTKRIIH